MPARSRLEALEAAAHAGATPPTEAAAHALSKARRKAADALDKAVNAELKPLKLERAKFSTEIVSDAERRRAERHRPRRILGADQSGHAAGAADEGRLRRRTGALPAGAEGGARRSRLGADAGLRRDRHRRRRRRRRRHRRAAGAACRGRAGAGRHARAAGRGARRPPLSHQQGRAGQGQTGGDPRQPKSQQSAAARRSPACSPAPRSPTRPAPPPSG